MKKGSTNTNFYAETQQKKGSMNTNFDFNTYLENLYKHFGISLMHLHINLV